MYKNYKLSNFFLLVALFLVVVISFIAYAWRKNGSMNIWNDNGEVTTSAFGEKGIDEGAPYYQTPESAVMDKENANRKNAEKINDDNGVNFPARGMVDSTGIPGQTQMKDTRGMQMDTASSDAHQH